MPDGSRASYQRNSANSSDHVKDIRTTDVEPVYVEHTTTINVPANQLARRRYSLARATQIIWLITGVVEALIGVRFLLKLIAANPEAGFAQFVYGMSGPFLVPFYNLTANPSVGGSVLEISSLIAMLVYALIAWGIIKVIWILFYQPPDINRP